MAYLFKVKTANRGDLINVATDINNAEIGYEADYLESCTIVFADEEGRDYGALKDIFGKYNLTAPEQEPNTASPVVVNEIDIKKTLEVTS